MLKNLFLWLIIAMVLIFVFSNFSPNNPQLQKYSYSEFLRSVDDGNVSSVTIDGQNIKGVTRNNQYFTTYMPLEDQFLLVDLYKKGVEIKGQPPEQESFLMHIFINWFPMLLFIGIWIFFMRQMQ